MAKFIKNPPSSDILMNSMRSMGYTFESAIADIIDNSISAKAKNIQLNFPIDPHVCYVSIFDDGIGMDSNKLYESMKYGSTSSRNTREANDLGRFGLGLKSASLSQCKKLTVASKCNGNISAYTWDLDLVGFDWLIQECDDSEIIKIHDIKYLISSNSGTLVIWENFDTLEKSTGDVFTTLNKYMEETNKYLSLIFHRFINSEKNKIKIRINNHDVEGYDPFLEKHPKTNIRREIEVAIDDSTGVERMILVQPFILPYHKDLSQKDIVKLGGNDSLLTKQGFYVYRNQRLIIWGTWFKMQVKNELIKHARIRVDIPNSLDDIWGIDIKKQNATLPKIIRNRLVKAIEEATDIAIKAQKYRGRQSNPSDKIEYIWDRIALREEKYSYQINRKSKIFELLDSVDDESRKLFDLVIEEIENNIPYTQIALDMNEKIINEEDDENRQGDIELKAQKIIEIYAKINPDKTQIINELFTSEPFCRYIDIKNKLLRQVNNHANR